MDSNKERVGPDKNKVTKPQREQWGSGLEFLMSCISMSIGLGNIWRFPFIANQYGGGAFLIPYLIVLIVIGRPMYYLEMVLGQFSSRGNLKIFGKLSPALKGIGYAQIVAVVLCVSYFSCIMAIILFYFFNSFTADLPWTSCRPEWEEYTQSLNSSCVDRNTNVSGVEGTTISSSELYFRREVLNEKDNISDGIGIPDWRLSLLILTTWLVGSLITLRGVKSSGKVAYFLAIFPYVILLTIVINVATLEGAADGMYYFIETDWKRMLDADVWYAAVTQCFFSLDIGFGGCIVYASFNRFEQNIKRDTLIVTTLDTFTSLLAGFIIFGMMGNLAYQMNVHPRDVLSGGGGMGITFISYPDAIATFKYVPWLFAILFFFMLFTIAIGTIIACQSVLYTVIKENFSEVAHWKATTCIGVAFSLLGMIYTTPGGQHVLTTVDRYGGTFIIFSIGIMEIILVAWIYGIDRFCLDLEFMTKQKVGIYWRLTWGVFTPCLLIIVFVYFMATIKPLTYGIFGLRYPIVWEVAGWLMYAIPLTQVFFWVGYYLYRNRKYPIKQMIKETFSTRSWSPGNEETAKLWRKFTDDTLNSRPTGESELRKLYRTLTGR